MPLAKPWKRIEFIVQGKTEHGVKKKELGERGSHDGRPPANVSKSKKRQALEDERIRQAIEGKFGLLKRRFGLNRVMAKLDNTSGTVIAITFLVMNRCFLVVPGFLCVFMSIWKKNVCFWVEDNL
jgi:hypothetical protein